MTHDAPTAGARMGIDVGAVRVGVAVSDPAGVLASPLQTLARRADGADVEELARLVAEHAAVEVVVGLPRTLAGREGPSAEDARRYAEHVAARVAPVPVRLVDERLSTVVAERALRAARPRQGARQRRRVVDQAAAVEILQTYLDGCRAQNGKGSSASSLVTLPSVPAVPTVGPAAAAARPADERKP